MNCFAYIRVSTTKQRDHGVSLEAQQEAIERYARANGLTITRWFKETKTAASRGRTQFAKLLELLRDGDAQGVIVHKIDRSARNLRDWADFAELADLGLAVHITAENLDFNSRGGRLSADIQAVVAADYIRNLRHEAQKGIQGRYRQGLLPGRAPLGYRDNGGGQVKTIDPVRAPLIKELFQRYATGSYSLRSLAREMTKRGLTNKRGRPLSVNSVSLILNNPFYYGALRVRASGELYEGKQEPLIRKSLFDACQALLQGRTKHLGNYHRFTFSRLLTCAECGHRLVAEQQKGHVYYRCHTQECSQKCVREERIEGELQSRIERLSLLPEDREILRSEVSALLGARAGQGESRREHLRLELAQLETRTNRLTDLLLDGLIDEETFGLKKRSLTERRYAIKEELERPDASQSQIEQRIEEYLELAESFAESYKLAEPYRKRQLVEEVTSNLTVSPENVAVELRIPFDVLAERGDVLCGGPHRDEPRTPSACPESQKTVTSLAETLVQITESIIETEKNRPD